jgi:hypothetical protein
MPLQAEGDLRLAFSAEEHNFLEILIGMLIRVFLLRERNHHFIPLLQNRSRLDLVHEAMLSLEGRTHWTSHMGFHCLLFWVPVKGGLQQPQLPERRFSPNRSHQTFTVY